MTLHYKNHNLYISRINIRTILKYKSLGQKWVKNKLWDPQIKFKNRTNYDVPHRKKNAWSKFEHKLSQLGIKSSLRTIENNRQNQEFTEN